MLRFALTATSELPLNALRVALINTLVSRQRAEPLILRIEDGDPKQSTLMAESRQILEKFAIGYDQILYQSDSRHRHQQLAVALLEQGKAFVCTCPDQADRCSGECRHRSPEQLGRIQEEDIPYVLRVTPPESSIVFVDLFRGELTAQLHEIGDIVILKTDGTPTDTFATAVDDMLNDITLVIRCDPYLSRTPEQIHIHHLLGYTEVITYGHVPPILPTTEADAPPTVPALLQEGFLPDAILNYLLLPNDDTPPQIFTLPEAINIVDLDAFPRSPMRFDREKLRWLNREHLRRMDDKALSGLYRFADADIGKLIKVYLDEAATLSELDEKIRPIFAPKPCEGEAREQMLLLAECIADAPYCERYIDFEAYLSAKTGWKSAELSPRLRRLITGSHDGPALSRLYPHIQSYITEVARCQP